MYFTSYTEPNLEPYGMSYLGAKTPSFNDMKVEKGKKYKIWFIRPDGLTDSLWKIVYNKLNVGLRYAKLWNDGDKFTLGTTGGFGFKSNKHRFEITLGAELVDGGKYIYIEGVGGNTGETFGELGLDRAWSTMNPLIDKAYTTGSIIPGGLIWRRRAVKGVKYYLITDDTGMVGEEFKDEIPSGAQEYKSIILDDEEEDKSRSGGKIPWTTIAIASAATIVTGIAAYMIIRDNKKAKGK